MNSTFDIVLFCIIDFIGLYGFYGLIKSIVMLVKYKKQDKQSVKDALFATMIVVFILHFIQMILGFAFNHRPFISPGVPTRAILTNDSFHLESLIFDFSVFAFIFNLIEYKKKSITKKRLLTPIIITGLIAVTFALLSKFLVDFIYQVIA